MKQYAFFLEPKGKVSDWVIEQKKEIQKIKTKQYFVKDPPHITLYLATLSSHENWIGLLDNFRLHVSRQSKIEGPFIFFNDIEKGRHTLALKVKQDTFLYDLQSEIVNILSSFLIKNTLFLSSILNKEPFINSYTQYGFPFVGKHWIPHITIGSLYMDIENSYLKTFQLMNIDYEFLINNLSVWEVENGMLRKIKSISFQS